MKPLYLITNLHRSGSSMLMRCLETGGLEGVYDPLANEMNSTAAGDYIPNPNGFYQFNEEVNFNFYNNYKGKLIKCYIRNILKLPPGNYKVILLKRNPKEIRRSMEAWTPFQSWGFDEAITYFYDEYLDLIIQELKKREDIDLVTLNYKDIVSQPEIEFNKLVKKGWPIDPIKASEMVDPELHRFKLETDG